LRSEASVNRYVHPLPVELTAHDHDMDVVIVAVGDVNQVVHVFEVTLLEGVANFPFQSVVGHGHPLKHYYRLTS
jgi:hypothetical protein